MAGASCAVVRSALTFEAQQSFTPTEHQSLCVNLSLVFDLLSLLWKRWQ